MILRVVLFSILFSSLGFARSLDDVLDFINKIEPQVIESALEVRTLGELVNTRRLAFFLKYDQQMAILFEQESFRALENMSVNDLIDYLNGITVYCQVDMTGINFLINEITGSHVSVDMAFFRNAIYVKKKISVMDRVTANLLAHEVVHGLQERGTIPVMGLDQADTFLVNYIEASLKAIDAGKSYLDNRFEIEAYNIGGRSRSFLNRYGGDWFKF